MKKWMLATLAVCSMQIGLVDGAAAYGSQIDYGTYNVTTEMNGMDELYFDMEMDAEYYDAQIAPQVEFGFIHVCTAANRRGRTFKARGDSRREAERRAMRRCYDSGSRRCEIVKCKRQVDVDF